MSLFRKKQSQINLCLHLALLKTKPGSEHDVYNTLYNTSDVIECSPLLGEWDFFIEIASPENLDIDIEERLCSITGISNVKFLTRPNIDRLPKYFKKNDVGFKKM